MAPHKIGIICEGATEKGGTISELIRKLGHKAEKPLEMHGIRYKKIPRFGEQLFRKGCEEVIVLIDSHCSDPIAKERDLRERIGDESLGDLDICVVVCSIESWLLCDENAVSIVVGKTIKIKNFNPDMIHDPVKRLDEIFKKCKGSYRAGYVKTTHARKIAENIDIAVLEKCSKSFLRFKTLISDPAK